MKKYFSITFLLLFFAFVTEAQKAMLMKDAEKNGTSIPFLDSIYMSAIHVDSTLSVFKTEADQQMMGNAYVKYLQDFGAFLSANNFFWERKTKAFNRIYISPDGTIDYVVYNFIEKDLTDEEKISIEKQQEFNRLLNLFVNDYKFPIKAPVKFAQCSPTTYLPKKN
jgi:hypothetical protein